MGPKSSLGSGFFTILRKLCNVNLVARKKTRAKAKRSGNKIIVVILFALFITTAFFVLQRSFAPYCANSASCKESFNVKIENGAVGTFMGQAVEAPAVDIAERPSANVLGEATGSGEKHIYVDLSTQTLTAKQGDTVYMQVPVSTGKWFPTPTGDFTIWEKIRATRMAGGEGADAYNLPNVPWVMFFGGSGVSDGRGFSLHGAYWHNNFGHPMSHGCVNMRIVDAMKLYFWADPRQSTDPTKITIYGTAPI